MDVSTKQPEEISSPSHQAPIHRWSFGVKATVAARHKDSSSELCLYVSNGERGKYPWPCKYGPVEHKDMWVHPKGLLAGVANGGT